MSKGHLKLDFLDIYLTTFFGAINFGNISAMTVILFEICLKFNIDFKNGKKIEKTFFVFEIIVS